MPTPVVRIAGYPLTAQRIEWAMTPGAKPDVMRVSFPAETARAIDEAIPLDAFVPMEIGTTITGFEEDIVIDREIKNLVLMQDDHTGSPWEAHWTIADQRWWLQHARWIDVVNLRRESNDKGVVLPDEPGGPISTKALTGKSAAGDKAASASASSTTQRAFITFGKFHHVAWTTNSDGSTRTALEVVRRILTAATLNGGRAAEVARRLLTAIKNLTDNLYFEADVTPNFDSVADALDYWSERAEINYVPLDDGSFFAYNINDGRSLSDVINPLYPTLFGGGAVSSTNKRRVRPGLVKVAFNQWREERFECRPIFDADDLAAAERLCWTVIQTPFDCVDVTVFGGAFGILGKRTYRKGTWVPIHSYLEWMVAEWGRDKVSTLKDKLPYAKAISKGLANLGTAIDWVRNNYLPEGRMESHFIEIAPSGGLRVNPKWATILGALRTHFLRSWQIHPDLMPFILDWEARRAGIVDPVTGTPAAAYASLDHCIVPDVMMLPSSRMPGAAATNVTAYDVSAKDASGTPTTISQVNKALGVFRVEWDTLSGGLHLGNVIPSHVDDIPQSRIGGSINTLWIKSALKDLAEYQGYIIVLVRWATDPFSRARSTSDPKSIREAMLYTIDVKPGQAGVTADTNPSHVVELMCHEDTARWSVETDEKIPQSPLNYEQLSALAKAKARQYYHQQRDREVGRWTFPGWSDAYRPWGAVRSILMTIEETGKLTTTFDCTVEPRPRVTWQMLPKEIRRTVFRQLPEPK